MNNWLEEWRKMMYKRRTAAEISEDLGMTAEQTHDYLAMLEAH